MAPSLNVNSRPAVGVVIVGLLLLLPAFASEAQTTVDVWNMAEFSFTSNTVYAKPVHEPSFSAMFTGPSGAVIVRPGYWDGGTTYRIRFAPTRTGIWSYTTSSTDSGLNNKTGTLTCVAYSGNQPLYQHGFVKVGSTGRYLAHDDGTPFLWMSDEHAFMDRESWSACNKAGCTSQFKYMVDRRVAQKFTVYESVIWTVSNWSTMGEVPTLKYYQDLDLKYEYIADHGLVSSIALGYHSNLGDGARDAGAVIATQRAARYVEARYGAYPMVYYTCGEFNEATCRTGCDPSRYQSAPNPGSPDTRATYNRDWWGEVAQTIEDNNSYNHPVSVNYWQPQGTWFGAESYMDFWAPQGYWLRDHNYYKFWWDQIPAKPIVDAWTQMDHDVGVTMPATHPTEGGSRENQRRAAYVVLQSGGAGWGHLTEGIWNNCYTQNNCGCCAVDWGGTAWDVAVDWAGATNMTYFYNFYTSLQWWKLTPRFGDVAWSSFADQLRSPVSSDGNEVYVIYFYNSTAATGSLKGMDNAVRYQAKWYNPRTGAYTLISSAIRASAGAWTVPSKPDSNDWVLLVRKN